MNSKNKVAPFESASSIPPARNAGSTSPDGASSGGFSYQSVKAAITSTTYTHIGMIISGLGLFPHRDQGRFDHPVWHWLDAIKGNDLILSGWLRPNAPALQVRSWAKPSANISNKSRSPLVGATLLSFTIYLLTAIGNAFS